MTAAGRLRPAAVAAIASATFVGLGLAAAPASAHSEGLTPYRYVAAPQGVVSEGPPETGTSTQPLGQAGFAGTTDNQMQLTLPEGALPSRAGERGARVTLDQLDPADLPDLPTGLEPEGNGYRVTMVYATSQKRVTRLGIPASLGLSAPAAPTSVYELVDGAWLPAHFAPAQSDAGFTSVVALERPGTFLQAYDPATAPAATRQGSGERGLSPGPALAGATVLLVAAAFLAMRRWGPGRTRPAYGA